MFDYEKEEQETTEEVSPDWENAEREEIVNSPEHQAEGDKRAADREAEDAESDALFTNFYERSEQRRKERTQISACRYGLNAIACGLLAYACSHYGINWLAHTIGIAAVAFAITSSYGFGRVYEMGR